MYKANGKPLRRGEHRPCEALRETICEATSEIDALNYEERQLIDIEANLDRDLKALGWARNQLDALSRIPDHGACITEMEARQRLQAQRRQLRAVLRRVRRSPNIHNDLTIEAIRQTAAAEGRSLSEVERNLITRARTISRRLKEIHEARADAERLLANAGRRADAEGCDREYVNQWCSR
ncbi:MAG: hypothetical protein ABL308_04580 [Oceanicaulis sp.]